MGQLQPFDTDSVLHAMFELELAHHFGKAARLLVQQIRRPRCLFD
jgi:hypothetical protein